MTVNTVTIVASAALIICLIAAAVALAFARWTAGEIIGLLSAVVGLAAVLLPLLDKAINLHRESGEQTATLRVIDKRTNGELDARIQAGAEQAATAVLRRFMEQPTAAYAPVVIPAQRTDEPASL